MKQVHPSHLSFFTILFVSMGRQADNRVVALIPRIRRKTPGGFDPIHDRHADIHEDQVELFLRGLSKHSRPLTASSTWWPSRSNISRRTLRFMS